MNLNEIEKLFSLSEYWIDFYEKDAKCKNPKYCDFYKGYKTYIKGVYEELDEAKAEIKKDNSVYLEDELGDVFWDYLCLLYSLEKGGYISDVQNVFKRSYKKMSERIDAKKDKDYTHEAWIEVKKKQKRELAEENERLYG